MELNDVLRLRRSVYALDKNVKVSDDEIRSIVETSLLHTPTGFNSQGPRAVLLLGKGHEKLWSLTMEALRQVVPAAAFKSTEDKINSFAAAYGTVVYFEEEAIVKNLQEKIFTLCGQLPDLGNPIQRHASTKRLVWFNASWFGVLPYSTTMNSLKRSSVRNSTFLPVGKWSVRCLSAIRSVHRIQKNLSPLKPA